MRYGLYFKLFDKLVYAARTHMHLYAYPQARGDISYKVMFRTGAGKRARTAVRVRRTKKPRSPKKENVYFYMANKISNGRENKSLRIRSVYFRVGLRKHAAMR